MNLKELETPCLIIDKDKLINNIDQLHSHISQLGANLRPHVKTIKNIDIIKLVEKNQINGITVSTLKEAEYFFANGITDILYAVGIAPNKLPRVIKLLQQGAKITIILDSLSQAQFTTQQAQKHQVIIPLLIEIDSDGHRSGLTIDNPLLVEIANYLHDNPHCALEGIITHAGESYNCRSTQAIQKMAKQEKTIACQAASILRQNNIPCPIVSIGSTPTARFFDDLNGITEVRAGVYMFYDLVMAGLGVCKIKDIAISVLTSIIGYQHAKSWLITDAGWMALSRDRGTAKQAIDRHYGLVLDPQGNLCSNLHVIETSQEHGIISTKSKQNIQLHQYKIGDLLRILPNHACATAAMHSCYYVVEDNSLKVNHIWQRVNGW